MRLNLMEKKALLGILVSITGMVLAVLIIGKRNLWFEAKNSYYAYYHDVEGLTEGSLVTLRGLRVGEVEALEVHTDNQIKVTFSVKNSLENKIRQDSIARQHRAFVIGEKRIDIVPGTSSMLQVPNGGEVKGLDSMDLPDLVSGKNIGNITGKLEGLLTGVKKWSDALLILSDKIGPNDLANLYQEMGPLLTNINTLINDLKDFTAITKTARRDLVGNGLLAETLKNTNNTMKNSNKILIPLVKREQLLEMTLNNVNTMMSEVAKEPNFAKDILGLLKEVSVTLKAIQKTWMLKSHVEDVKKEKNKS
ncbi:MAG: MCE family protein [Bdellovibrio sp.]|nr:MCE family protein [Bdellovibrio sp.]